MLGLLCTLSLSLSLSLSCVLCLVSCVFVKCNAISTFVYKYLLLRRITKFIYTGRLSSWKLCLCPCIRLCVCLCLCLCHLQMNPGAVLFPTMYDMLIVMFESWKYWCLMMIGLVTGEGEGGGKSHCKVGTRWVRQRFTTFRCQEPPQPSLNFWWSEICSSPFIRVPPIWKVAKFDQL